eukprot:3458767-Rhodomonas_salina.1
MANFWSVPREEKSPQPFPGRYPFYDLAGVFEPRAPAHLSNEEWGPLDSSPPQPRLSVAYSACARCFAVITIASVVSPLAALRTGGRTSMTHNSDPFNSSCPPSLVSLKGQEQYVRLRAGRDGGEFLFPAGRLEADECYCGGRACCEWKGDAVSQPGIALEFRASRHWIPVRHPPPDQLLSIPSSVAPRSTSLRFTPVPASLSPSCAEIEHLSASQVQGNCAPCSPICGGRGGFGKCTAICA